MRISDWSSDVCSSDLTAGPSMPVEVLGLGGVPMAGDTLTVVENEARAREVAAYRQSEALKKRTVQAPVNLERSEERRVGKECGRKCRSRWSPYHLKKT